MAPTFVGRVRPCARVCVCVRVCLCACVRARARGSGWLDVASKAGLCIVVPSFAARICHGVRPCPVQGHDGGPIAAVVLAALPAPHAPVVPAAPVAPVAPAPQFGPYYPTLLDVMNHLQCQLDMLNELRAIVAHLLAVWQQQQTQQGWQQQGWQQWQQGWQGR